MPQRIHLVRHGEVENPTAVIYGRLPGFHLSERGRNQAMAAAQHLGGSDVGAIWASPLERARETAQAIAEVHGMPITTDARLLESLSAFEGVGRNLLKLLGNPAHWWHLRNPMTPSWGESFAAIAARMTSAIAEARAQAGGREVVVVSHQTPVMVARNALARRRRPPWLTRIQVQTGSVTTLVMDEGGVLDASYFVPA